MGRGVSDRREELRGLGYSYQLLEGSELDPSWRGAFVPVGDPVHGFGQVVASGEPADATFHYLVLSGQARWRGHLLRIALTCIPPTGQVLGVQAWSGESWQPVPLRELTGLELDCPADDLGLRAA